MGPAEGRKCLILLRLQQQARSAGDDRSGRHTCNNLKLWQSWATRSPVDPVRVLARRLVRLSVCRRSQFFPTLQAFRNVYRAGQYRHGLPTATGPANIHGPAIPRRFCYYEGLLLVKWPQFPSSRVSCGYMYPVASCHSVAVSSV